MKYYAVGSREFLRQSFYLYTVVEEAFGSIGSNFIHDDDDDDVGDATPDESFSVLILRY